jgi:hypothetical protein
MSLRLTNTLIYGTVTDYLSDFFATISIDLFCNQAFAHRSWGNVLRA